MEKVNLQEVARLQAKMAGKEPPVYDRYLFWYTIYTFVQDGQYQTLIEKQAEDKLKQYHTPKMMQVYYCKLVNTPTPMPSELKGRRGLITEEVTGHEEVSDLIYRVTGVKVPESELRAKPKMWMQDSRPLPEKIRTFMQKVDEGKKHDQEIDRIVKCLKENDPRKRKDCLNNNCKTK